METKELARLETKNYESLWKDEVRKNDRLSIKLRELTQAHAELTQTYGLLVAKFSEHKRRQENKWYNKFRPTFRWIYGKSE